MTEQPIESIAIPPDETEADPGLPVLAAEALQEAEPQVEVEPVLEPAPQPAPRRGRGWVIALAVVVVILLAGAGGFLWLRSTEERALQDGKTALASQDWAAAETALTAALAVQPDFVRTHSPEAIALRAEARFQQQNWSGADEDFKRAAELGFRLAPAAVAQRAEIALQAGDVKTAGVLASQALIGDPNLAMPVAIHAYEAYRNHNYKMAEEKATKAIRMDADNGLAYRTRGLVYGLSEAIDLAKPDLDRALELDPGDVQARAMRVYISFASIDPDRAREDLKQFSTADLKTPAGLWAQAMALDWDYDEAKALDLMNQAIAADDSRPEYYLFRSECYDKTSQLPDARADIEKALSLHPEMPRALFEKAMLSLDDFDLATVKTLGEQIVQLVPAWYGGPYVQAAYQKSIHNNEKALEYINKSIKLSGANPLPYVLRGRIYYSMHEVSKAQKDYELAREKNPASLSSSRGLIELYTSQRNYEEATKLVEEYIARDPDYPGGYLMRSQILLAQDEKEKAKKDLEKAFEIDPSSYEAYVWRVFYNLSKQDALAAIGDANHIIELYPKDPFGYVLRSWVYLADQNLERAREDASQAILLDKKDATAYGALADIYLAKQDLDSARVNIERALEYDDLDINILGTYGRFNLADSDPLTAIDTFTKLILLDKGNQTAYLLRADAYQQTGQIEEAIADLETFLDMASELDQINAAESMLDMLKQAPPLVDGQRVFNSPYADIQLSYPGEWLWNAPEDDVTILSLYHPDEPVFLEVQYFGEDPQGNPLSNIGLQEIADGVEYAVIRGQEGNTFLSRESFRAGGLTGVTLNYLSEGTDEDGYQYSIQFKVYIFVKDNSRVIVINLGGSPERFDTLEEMGDEIVSTLVFLEH